jgi:solute carrier family 13 (sodium-dependent dicarboxylate transporter), member 2/3/5
MSKAALMPPLASTVPMLPRTGGLVEALAPCLALLSAWALWTQPEALGAEARVALIVTVLAMIGWTLTKIPESIVALGAAMALVLTGTVGEDRLFATLGSDLVWLLLAAFIIAAVIKDAGLAERMVAPLTARRPRFAGFAFALAAGVALTALVLPSTSGRAALLLPVFLALLPLLPDARLARALALIFPTVILLSAGGSLIGAGAHLIAVEAMVATGAPRLDYLDWLMLGGPLAVLASAAGVALILALFVPRGLWTARMAASDPAGPRTAQQSRILAVIVVLVALWLSEAWHGLGMSLVAMMGALVLLTRPFTNRKTKEVFRAVDMELILYMAATMLIAQAMTTTGADDWLAAQAMSALPPALLASSTGVVIGMSVIAVLAHLAIASRSARAAILIPAVALPMAGLGQDATLMILIAVMGTGFCQTLMSSAKPVAIYGLREEAGFSQADLLRLALPLGVVKAGLLVAFALFVWPKQILSPNTSAPEAVPATASPQVLAIAPIPAAIRTALSAMPAETAQVPLLSSSLWPRPRPEGLGRAITAEEQVSQQPRPRQQQTRPANLGTRIERELNEAARQFERDVNHAARQFRRDMRALFR